MLKFLGIAVLVCVGSVVALSFWVVWRIRQFGRSFGGTAVTTDTGYITTTATTIHDDSPTISSFESSAGESIGSEIGADAVDFGSGDSGGDSGGGDSGGSRD